MIRSSAYLSLSSFRILTLFRKNNIYTGANFNQVFTITLILPFISTTLGLLCYNWYPAKVFVGDTFCYFAGMTFAVLGIHGHFSKTLAFLVLPQIMNFLISIPQLFKFLPCPRHRLPKFDAKTNTVSCSTAPCKKEDHQLFKVLFGLRKDEEYYINYTLINVVLRILGPMHERTLSTVLLVLQAVCCLLALYGRAIIANNYL